MRDNLFDRVSKIEERIPSQLEFDLHTSDVVKIYSQYNKEPNLRSLCFNQFAPALSSLLNKKGTNPVSPTKGKSYSYLGDQKLSKERTR